ncbi:MAG: FAD-dependent oxidoreductase [Aureliella sp.]
MTASRATHHSYWLSTCPAGPKYEPLRGRERTQVAILGGGITGLSTALELLERGQQVAVLESLFIGAGTSGGSTGHLDAHPEPGPRRMISDVGLENAKAMVAARLEAIDLIERRSTPECDFRRIPAYQYSDSPLVENNKSGDPPPRIASVDDLEREMKAAAELGLSVTWSASPPIPRGGYGYRIDNMARFNSLAYVQRLAELVVQRGGKIYEQSLASGPTGSHPTELKVGEGVIEFEHVVCAVHCNYTDVLRTYFQTPAYQSYVIAVRVNNPPPDALFWDTSDPYYYTRHARSDQPDLIIVGGCDKRTGAHSSDEVATALRSYVRDRYDVREIVAEWSAELFEPVDEVPIVGRLPGKENVWIATGLSGVGLTWGTASGRILAEQITGNQTPLDKLLSPSRLALDSIPTLVSEHATTTADLLQRVLPAHRFDAGSLKPGEGEVGVDQHQHVAACRERSGCLHRKSPICTHMGGVVHWNEAEQTWDCPVHGGRFNADGSRLYGPPEKGLEEPSHKAKE